MPGEYVTFARYLRHSTCEIDLSTTVRILDGYMFGYMFEILVKSFFFFFFFAYSLTNKDAYVAGQKAINTNS